MAHVALYREWRPLTFDAVVEQSHVVTALRQAVVSGQVAHAYLFSGTRGTGKTTVAKIFSRSINCLRPQDGNPCNACEICTGILNGSLLDVVEMDAASNNSVDTIRRIVDEVVFMPSQARYKVYIVDEAHMLSTGAFNALLKTLEEPPAHAVFILATTEPYRVPATILSRCQRYEFRRIPLASLVSRLREIADTDGIAVEAEALDAIARLAEGGMRDAISLLDQVRMTVATGRPVSRDDVLRMTGVADDDLMAQVCRALLTSDAAALLDGIGQLVMTGRDPARFLIDLAAYCRNLLVVAVTPDPSELLQVTSDQLKRLQDLARLTDSSALVSLVRELSALHGELRWSSDSRTTLEVGLLRLMSQQPAVPDAPSGISGSAGAASLAGARKPATAAVPATPPVPAQPAAAAPSKSPSPAAAVPSMSPSPAATVPTMAPFPPAATAPSVAPAQPAEPVRPVMPASQPFPGDPDRSDSFDLTGLEAPPLPEPPPEDTNGYNSMPPARSAAPVRPAAAPPPAAAPAAAKTPVPADLVRPTVHRADIFAPAAPAAQESASVPARPAGAQPEPAAADTVVRAAAAADSASAPAAYEPAAAGDVPASTGNAPAGTAVFAAPSGGAADPQDRARWQAIQDQLISDGQMTLYLFSRAAAFSFCGGELHLLFADKDKINYQELRESQNIKALRSAATRIVGTDTPVVVRLAADPEAEALSCPVPREPAWVTRVKEAADEFGIPVKMEEN